MEAAGGIEVIAEGVEFLRRHRLEHVDLVFEQPLNRVDAAEILADLERFAAAEMAHRRFDLVQHLLEPQLVDLMDDDEEQLVVVRRVALRNLQREQLVDVEIRAVGQRGRWGRHATLFGERRPWTTNAPV